MRKCKPRHPPPERESEREREGKREKRERKKGFVLSDKIRESIEKEKGFPKGQIGKRNKKRKEKKEEEMF